MKASPKKLRDGSWGALVTGDIPRKGETITVVTKSGRARSEKVKSVLWRGSSDSGLKTAIVSLVGTSSGTKSTRCSECKGPIRDASHHRAMGGLCGSCAFDEYDG